MKKVVLNISDTQYEKFRIEAMHEKKSISEILRDRIFYKPFSSTVEEYFDMWMENNLQKQMED